MIVHIDKELFDSLPIDAIGHACFEPLVPVYQEGMRQQDGREPQEYRASFFKQLSQGQRALFIFFSYYDHAIRSYEEFKRISYYYLSQQIFGAVRKGAKYFHDNNMSLLLQRAEQVISASGETEATLDEIYQWLRDIAPCTSTIIGTFIKENPAEFICFE